MGGGGGGGGLALECTEDSGDTVHSAGHHLEECVQESRNLYCRMLECVLQESRNLYCRMLEK